MRSMGRNIALLSTRTFVLIASQIVFFLFLGSWEKTIPYWPIQAIPANLFCILFLFVAGRAGGERIRVRRIYFSPFSASPKIGSFEESIIFRRLANRGLNLLRDAIIAIVIFLALGLPCIVFSNLIGGLGGVDTTRLPFWAKCAVIVFFPVSQLLAEIPWYFGSWLPLIERNFDERRNAKLPPALAALGITALAFDIQHLFMPFSFDPHFMFRNALTVLPLILVVGLTIRFFPRLMPIVITVQFALALKLASQCL